MSSPSIPSSPALPGAPLRNTSRNIWIALLTVYLVWGSTYLAIRFALVSFPPFLQMGSRFLCAGVLLFLWQWLVRKAPLPTARQWRDGGIVGVLLLGGGMGMTAYASQYVGSGLIALFIAVSPLMLALWSGLLGSWPVRREWLGIAIGFSGIVLLATGKSFSAAPEGLIAQFCALMCWTLGSALSQRKLTLAPGAMGFASEMLIGGVFLLIIAAVRGESAHLPLEPRAVGAWIYLVVFGSLVAFSAYMYLLANTAPATASSYAYVNPVIAIALGVWLGGETITSRELWAMAVILPAVLLMTTARRGTQS
jgi:drug/metabolite transporter (DMT)-like permease